MTDFKETEFVVFDIETTGLSWQSGDRIVEIAALRLHGLEPAGEFHSLVDPGREISFGAYQVNGITPGMVAGAPRAMAVLPEFMNFVLGGTDLPLARDNICLVAHNAKFDMGFLLNELEQMGFVWPGLNVLDTLRMAKGLLPGLRRYSLLSLASYFDIGDIQAHRAQADVLMTFRVLRRLLEYAWRWDIQETGVLINLFGLASAKALEARGARHTALIEEAIICRKTLQLLYASPYSCSLTERVVSPQSLEGGKLVAYCHLRGERRDFIVERIVRMNFSDSVG